MAWIALCTVIGVLVVYPMALAMWTAVRGAGSPGNPGSWPVHPTLSMVLQTILWPISIALGSVVLAWPVAWKLGRTARPWRPWLAVPLTMPTYLAYSGYGIVRSPGTWFGDWLQTVGREQWSDAPFVVGQMLAWLGLVLWSWPIAAGILIGGVRAVDPSIDDALSMDGRAGFHRLWMHIRLVRGTLVCTLAILSLLMLGSAIPLHLAQVEAWSLKLWLALDNVPREGRWRVFVLATPLLAAAALAGWWISGWAIRGAVQEDHIGVHARTGVGRGGIAATVWMCIAWTASSCVPLALFAGSIREARSLIEFWRINADAVGWSALIAVLTGLVCTLVTLAVWILVSSRSRPGLLRVVLTILVACGLSPGVIVGAIVNEAWNQWPWQQSIADTLWVVVLAHGARFAWIGGLVGLVLAGLEPRERREQRALDGDDSLWGWWLTSARPALGALVGSGVAVGLLSLHEIESTVMVQPPGIDGLSRRILQLLHFSSMEDLFAAGVWLVGGGLVLSVLAAWASRNQWRSGLLPDSGVELNKPSSKSVG